MLIDFAKYQIIALPEDLKNITLLEAQFLQKQ
jgi:hypothetical protein